MSTKKMYDIEKLLTEIKYVKKLDSWISLSGFLGVDDARLSAWRKRNSQAAMSFIEKKCREDFELREIMLTIDDFLVESKNVNMPVNIVDYRRIDVDLQPTDGETAQMVAGILASQSQLNRVALITSVKALFKACQGEVEMTDMRNEMAMLHEKMDSMLKMVAALVPGFDKKRETTIGN
jgi:hypothetical protein